MRWVCPQCGATLSVALTECPYCTASSAQAPPEPELPAGELLAPPLESRPAVAPAPQTARAVRPTLPATLSAIRAQARRAAEMQEQMSPFRRGLEMGVGFMLAVAVTLFLFALLSFWLSQEGWQPWWEWLLR